MTVMQWFLWFLTETTKYILIMYGVMGFTFNKHKYKCVSLLYILAVIPMQLYLKDILFIYRTLWGLVLIILIFDGAISKKIQMYVVSYFFITIIDISFGKISSNSDAGKQFIRTFAKIEELTQVTYL